MRRGLTSSTRTGSGRFRLDAFVIAAIIGRRAAFGGAALGGAASIVLAATDAVLSGAAAGLAPAATCRRIAAGRTSRTAPAAAAALAVGTAFPITARLARSAACLVVGAEELIVPTLLGFL
jgi:hypothetical protein